MAVHIVTEQHHLRRGLITKSFELIRNPNVRDDQFAKRKMIRLSSPWSFIYFPCMKCTGLNGSMLAACIGELSHQIKIYKVRRGSEAPILKSSRVSEYLLNEQFAFEGTSTPPLQLISATTRPMEI